MQGRYDEAERLTEECERATRQNDIHSQILWRSTRAKVFARRGEHVEAERLAREALGIANGSDFLVAHADALADLSEVLELAGRRGEAVGALEESINLHSAEGQSRRSRCLPGTPRGLARGRHLAAARPGVCAPKSSASLLGR